MVHVVGSLYSVELLGYRVTIYRVAELGCVTCCELDDLRREREHLVCTGCGEVGNVIHHDCIGMSELDV